MSASVYNSPYTWQKPPPPRIDYPSYFGKGFSFRYISDSKFLFLAAVILGASLFVTVICILLPFWMKLIFSQGDGTFGSEPVYNKLTIDAGIFYLKDTEMDNTAFLTKYTNREVVPKMLALSQVFAVLHISCQVLAVAGTGILVFRKFSSLTGVLFLSAIASFGAVCGILMMVFMVILVTGSTCDPYSGDRCNYGDNRVWRNLPIYEQIYRVATHVTPYIEANFAIYIATFGVLLSIGGCVLLWLEGLLLWKTVRDIRYKQLKEVRDPYENEIDPSSGRRFVYAEPTFYGHSSYGMQPVVQAGPTLAPPAHYGHSVGFRQPPPSNPSSTSGSAAMTREIDL